MEDRYEEALEGLHGTDPEYAGYGLDGLSNHGPMVAEAFVSLGLEHAIAPFLTQYEARLRPMAAGRGLSEPDRARCLGDASRMADWVASWEHALERRAWREVVAEAVPRLSDGVLASALHGWLRVAHAIRALQRADTPRRRRELAHGLGLWSARYQPLSGAVGSRPQRGWAAGAMLAEVPHIETPRGGLIFDRVRPVAQSPEFIAAVSRWDPDTFELDSFVRAAMGFGADRVLGVPEARIAFVHVVTGASALRTVAPLLPSPAVRALAGHLLEVIAALEAVYGARFEREDGPVPARAALLEAVNTTPDDHAVKLAEVALREDTNRAQPQLLRAAAALLGVIP